MSETTNAAEDTARIRAEFTVEGALAGMRLDAALAGALDAFPDIEVEGKRASAPSFVKSHLKLFVLREGKLLEHEDCALAPFCSHPSHLVVGS